MRRNWNMILMVTQWYLIMPRWLPINSSSHVMSCDYNRLLIHCPRLTTMKWANTYSCLFYFNYVNKIDYPPFHRNFYHEHSEIAAMTRQDLQSLRKKLGLSVSIFRVIEPHMIRLWHRYLVIILLNHVCLLPTLVLISCWWVLLGNQSLHHLLLYKVKLVTVTITTCIMWGDRQFLQHWVVVMSLALLKLDRVKLLLTSGRYWCISWTRWFFLFNAQTNISQACCSLN